MSKSLCQRCSLYFRCALNYDGVPCRKNRDVEPTVFEKQPHNIEDISPEELAKFLAEWASTSLPCKRDPGEIEEGLKGERL